MKHALTPLEARVIGCLIEKQVTTPDQYPLSLNALTAACNQKTNRDPLLNLGESEVQAVVDGLQRKHLVIEKSGFGSRVPKYQQRFCNLEFSSLQFTPLERAIVCELLLRGAQSSGELRTRAARLAPVSGTEEVESALQALAAREPNPLVVRLPRESGQRDVRWAQTFTGAAPAQAPGEPSATAGAPIAPPAAASRTGTQETERLAALEAEVRALHAEMDALRALLESRPPQRT